MKKNVILSVSNNLETDQRINKIATSLFNHGFGVTVVGTKSRPCHQYETAYNNIRLNAFFKKGFLFYAEFNLRLFIFLLIHHYDILVSNDTDTVLPNFIISKIKGICWVADFHELFPEVPEVSKRKFVKFFWTKIEDFTFPHITKGYTVCDSIASYYKKRYNIQLEVIRNISNQSFYEGKKSLLKKDYGNKKIILYQGAVNIGRGIEWVMDAMKYIDNAIFVVIGKGDLFEVLKEKSLGVDYKDKVKFIGAIPYSNLNNYTQSADLGVCLLQNLGLSYYYSLPNRIFDFMHAHVPILAMDFPEIHKILSETKTGELISSEDPFIISQKIRSMLDTPIINHAIYQTASEKYNWEKEEKKLLAIYDSLNKFDDHGSN